MSNEYESFCDLEEVVVDEKSFAERFKLKTNEMARIGLIYPEGAKGPFIEKKSVWYEDKNGGKYCIDIKCIPESLHKSFKVDEAKQKFGGLVVKYKTDKKGQLVQPLDYEILEWIFSGQKFIDIRNIAKEYDLRKVDLNINCSDEKFQKFSMFPTKGSAMVAGKIEKQVLEEATKMIKSLSSSLGRTFTEEELKEMLGQQTLGNVVASPEELDSALANI